MGTRWAHPHGLMDFLLFGEECGWRRVREGTSKVRGLRAWDAEVALLTD